MTTTAPTTPTTRVTSVSHIAVNTADLDRFRRFYEDVLGLHLVVDLQMDHPPHLRHAILAITDSMVLHAFEVPGYDPVADGIATEMGQRGRIDHFGLMVPDRDTLAEVAARLVAAGASDGEIRKLGPFCSVHVKDPDGLELEVNCPDLDFDPAALNKEVREIGRPDWYERLLADVVPASA